MTETTASGAGAPLDPTTADPRELMQALLPAARAQYIKAWELLVDPATPLQRRRAARERAAAVAKDHAVVAQFLRERERTLAGDPLQNARHLADELERHVAALERMSTISLIGLGEAKDLRPEALGCGRRYRDPAKSGAGEGAPTRPSARSKSSGAKPREPRDRAKSDRPFSDRGPKVSRDALGSSKHDSSLGDDLDPETRARLEAMRAMLEGSE